MKPTAGIHAAVRAIAAAGAAVLALASPAWSHQGSHDLPAAARAPASKAGASAAPKVEPGAVAKTGPARASDEAARSYFTDRPMVDQDGRALRFYTDVLKDRVVLINFVFTECQDTCPTQSQKLSEVQKLVQAQMGREVRFVSISVDPERDTPQALKTFARRFEAGNGWLFLTGDKDDVFGVIRKLGQLGPSVESHSTLFILGNVATGHWMKLRPDTTAPTIARHLQTLASERPARAASN